jgi:hypothetical protein
MSGSKLPKFQSVEELVEFFDSHDLGEFWADLPEAQFEVDLKRRTFLVAVDGRLMKKLARFAKTRNTSTHAIVNAWLQEKLAQAA